MTPERLEYINQKRIEAREKDYFLAADVATQMAGLDSGLNYREWAAEFGDELLAAFLEPMSIREMHVTYSAGVPQFVEEAKGS